MAGPVSGDKKVLQGSKLISADHPHVNGPKVK